MAKTKFPALAVILLLLGIVWLLNSMGVYTIDIPWLPVVVIIVAVAMIFNRFSK